MAKREADLIISAEPVVGSSALTGFRLKLNRLSQAVVTYIRTYVHTHVHTKYIHTYVRTYIHTYVRTYTAVLRTIHFAIQTWLCVV